LDFRFGGRTVHRKGAKFLNEVKCWVFGSLVNIPAMSDSHHQYQKLPIPDLAKDAVIADSVTPQSSQVRLEAFAETARIALA
jgi:hypothetical protein